MKLTSMKIVKARFESCVTFYEYFVPADNDPKPGDLIVTSVKWSGEDWNRDAARLNRSSVADSARVARIESVEDWTKGSKATKFYLALISLDNLEAMALNNRIFLDREKAKKEARERLEKMLEEQAVTDRYKHLAASNPEAAALLKLFDE